MIKKGICLFYVFIFSLFFVCIQATALEEAKTIRVGYSETMGFINNPIISGREGYGYEYVNKIAEYLDEDYIFEYVLCEESSILSMLENDEIDIVAPYFKEQVDEEMFMFSADDFGQNIAFLCTTSNGSTDISALEGSTIGVYKDDPNIYLIEDLLETYGYQATIIYFDNYDFYLSIQPDDCDYCLAYSMSPNMNLEIVMKLESFPFYFVSMKENKDLMEELNHAIEAIESYEFLFQEQLYLKYYQYQISNSTYLSQDEMQLLQSKESYSVGVYLLHSPFAYLDSEGKLQGIIFDYLLLLEEIAGITFDIYIIEENETLDYDFTMLYSNEEITLSSDLSYSYLEQSLVLLENNGDEINNLVGTLSYYGIDYQYLQQEYGNENVIVYRNLSLMQQAFDNNEIQSMILTSSALSYIQPSLDNKNYYIDPLNMDISFSMKYSSSMSNTVIHSFNKLIASVDEDLIDYIVLKHSTSGSESFSLADYLKDNPLYVMSALGLLVVIYFIFELNRKKELLNIVYYDKLTGVYSLEGFKNVLKTRLSQKKQSTYVLVSIDIDNFKYINELYGFDVGTQIIKKNASFIKNKLEKSDVIARVSAEQFIVLLHRSYYDLSLDNFRKKENAIFHELEKVIGQDFIFTYSVGVYEIINPKLDINFMIDCVNFARQKGKSHSEDTVFCFDDAILQERSKNAEIITSMNYALQEKEFILYYQPKVDLRTKKIVGAEALVRWQKNDSFILPSNFIPVFEKNGFIEKLDYYVFETVCQFIVSNKDIDIPKISINISGLTVTKGNVLLKLNTILQRYQLSPDRIDIELTETAFIDNGDIVIDTLKELRENGFSVSMDDFGAGLSSLTRLKNITIDTLKIDRELIVEKGSNKGVSILKNVLSLGKDIRVTTVGEGIETYEQLELLKSLGCDIGQGYYFYQPLKEDDFLKELYK